MKAIVSLIVLFTALFNSNLQAQTKRVALVIGAQHYEDLPSLRNALNDAKAMAEMLQKKGFLVKPLYDPKTKREIKEGINWYFNEMREQSGAVGLIFYAGHGMQYEGDNFIIPTTATLQNPGDLEDYCVKMNTIMEILRSASKSLNILLLDACRSLPSFTRDPNSGLTRMEAPQGSIIVFATQAGKVASDGSGKNGLFTTKLLKVINENDINIADVFKKVKQEVYAESNETQLPSVEDNSIGGDFYFTVGASSVPQNQNAVTPEVKKESGGSGNVNKDFGYGLFGTKTVVIGQQLWINKNLNADHFANGDLINQAKTDEEWHKAANNKQPAWCYYKNDPENGIMYGRLYNWYAVSDSRGLCPTGWHVPSDLEWTEINTLLGTTAGTQMKATVLWEANGNGHDAIDFTALPGGYRNFSGYYSGIGENGYWWSTTPYATYSGWYRELTNKINDMKRANFPRGNGGSVRCIQNKE